MTHILIQANSSSSVEEKMDEKRRMFLERKRRNQMYSKNGLKYQNFSSPNENSYKQTNSKICSKTSNKSQKKGNSNNGPLKQTNNRNNYKVKNMPDAQLYGSVIQKVDYYPKKKKTQTETKKSPVKSDGISTSAMDYNSMSESDSLQILASKYSKFLQEKFGSNPNSEQSINKNQQVESPKNKKQVKFQKEVRGNGENQSNVKRETKSQPKLVLQQSITSYIDRPDVEDEDSVNSNDKITTEKESPSCIDNSLTSKSTTQIVDKEEIEKQNPIMPNVKNDDLFEDDSNDDFNIPEPKTPPKPTIHNEIENQNTDNKIVIDNSIFREAEREKELIQELLKKREAIESRINNTLALNSKQSSLDSYETTPFSFQKNSSTNKSNRSEIANQSSNLDYDTPINKYTGESKLTAQFMESGSTDSQPQLKSKVIDLQTDDSDDLDDYTEYKTENAPNCVNLDPLSFVPKKRIFDMSASESGSDSSIITTPQKELPKPIENKKVPRSPHVTWDISNCPPIVPKKSRKFEDQFDFNFINYDELNDFDVNNAECQGNSEPIDFNEPNNFSKAMKFPSNFLKDFNNSPDEMGDEELLDDDIDDEDTNDNIPNYSRITTMLRLKVDKDVYNDAVKVMNQYKMKHFILSINKKLEVEAVYSLRSDLRFATLIWGDGISTVYTSDILKFYTINLKTKQFELQRIHKFQKETEAFILE